MINATESDGNKAPDNRHFFTARLRIWQKIRFTEPLLVPNHCIYSFNDCGMKIKYATRSKKKTKLQTAQIQICRLYMLVFDTATCDMKRSLQGNQNLNTSKYVCFLCYSKCLPCILWYQGMRLWRQLSSLFVLKGLRVMKWACGGGHI